MPNFIVEICVTQFFEIEVEAEGKEEAYEAAREIYFDAADVNQYDAERPAIECDRIWPVPPLSTPNDEAKDEPRLSPSTPNDE